MYFCVAGCESLKVKSLPVARSAQILRTSLPSVEFHIRVALASSNMLACVYLMTGMCLVHGVREWRRYWGIYKIRANQTRESARSRRFKNHVTRPVAWLKNCDASTMRMEAVGHPMGLADALVQEAIMAAAALEDGQGPSRGGPWAHPHLGDTGRAEAKAVSRIAGRASSPAQARADVLEYAMSLDENSYLRMHCMDQQFKSDSHETEQGRRPRTRRGKRYQSGYQKRKSWGLKGWAFLYHKYGSDVEKNQRSSLATRTRARS